MSNYSNGTPNLYIINTKSIVIFLYTLAIGRAPNIYILVNVSVLLSEKLKTVYIMQFQHDC